MTSNQTDKSIVSTQAGNDHGYFVEAMARLSPVVLGGQQIITSQWTRINLRRMAPGEGGIVSRTWNPLLAHNELLSYEAALALMATLAASSHDAGCLDYRLVRCNLKYEWAITRVGVTAPKNFLAFYRDEKFTPEEESDV